MSHIVEGFTVITRPGKFLRTYRIRGDKSTYMQETPDLACATVFRKAASDVELLTRAFETWPKAACLNVRVIRTVEIM
jgi:hypothetical protein